jgi:hypothetical protein
MSASRDDYSQDSQSLQTSEQQHLSDIDDAQQYVPEREFVLMPLFRRIGQLFGIGGHEQPKYVYDSAPEPQATIQSRVAEPEPEASVQDGFDAHSVSAGAAPETASEDLLGIESQETIQPFADDRNLTPESLVVHYEPVGEAQSHINEGLEQAAAEQAFNLPVEETRPETLPYPERPQLELVHSQSSAQQSTDLTAPLREAALKISAAISQAAEWLHRKEEEILQRAQLPQSSVPSSSDSRPLPANDVEERIEPLPGLPLEAHTLIASTPAVIPIMGSTPAQAEISNEIGWQRLEAPALQREVAWQQPRDPEPMFSESVQAGSPTTPRQSMMGERKPRLVPAPVRVPFWNRIDWAQEFTPKRVAVLGGVAMAVMMILGISLARRPASSMLPQQQQQARTHQPGGVTLTTHPAAAARTSNQQTRRATPPPSVAVAPVERHSNRQSEYNEGPDVVTHYYNAKQKPSPTRQSTVAGVRHYSDM